MADTKLIAISIDRGLSRQALTFNEPNDIIAFLDVEKEFWAWTETGFNANNGGINSAPPPCEAVEKRSGRFAGLYGWRPAEYQTPLPPPPWS